MHSWLAAVLKAALRYRPKEDVADKILFVAIVVGLVLMAGLMSGARPENFLGRWVMTSFGTQKLSVDFSFPAGLTLGLLSISKTDVEVRLIRTC